MNEFSKKFQISSILKKATISSTKKSKSKEKTKTEKKEYGDYGRIEIPDLQISIPLYRGKDDPQGVVDRKNAAAFLEWKDQNVIVDHTGQDGFEKLEKAVPSQTLAYIDFGFKKERYMCTRKQIGHLLLGDTNKIRDANYVFPKSPGLIIYTCKGLSAPNVMDIWLTYWKRC